MERDGRDSWRNFQPKEEITSCWYEKSSLGMVP